MAERKELLTQGHGGRGVPITRRRLERRLAWLLALAFSAAVWVLIGALVADVLHRF